MTFENMGLSMFVLVLDVELACYLSKNKSIPNNKGRKVSVVGSSNTFFSVLSVHQTPNYPLMPLVSSKRGHHRAPAPAQIPALARGSD
jgi:hypothetical protein